MAGMGWMRRVISSAGMAGFQDETVRDDPQAVE